jgi:hypothetical protein
MAPYDVASNIHHAASPHRHGQHQRKERAKVSQPTGQLDAAPAACGWGLARQPDSAQSMPVYPYTLAASSCLAWPLVPLSAHPDQQDYQCVCVRVCNQQQTPPPPKRPPLPLRDWGMRRALPPPGMQVPRRCCSAVALNVVLLKAFEAFVILDGAVENETKQRPPQATPRSGGGGGAGACGAAAGVRGTSRGDGKRIRVPCGRA